MVARFAHAEERPEHRLCDLQHSRFLARGPLLFTRAHLSSTRLSPRTLHLKESVGQGDGVDVSRQPRLYDEHYRHLSRFVGLELLPSEAEALELLEITASHLRAIARDG